jgi:hypothetical protein
LVEGRADTFRELPQGALLVVCVNPDAEAVNLGDEVVTLIGAGETHSLGHIAPGEQEHW